MARQDDGKDLLALWQDAVEEDGDILRRLMEHVLNDVLEAEITEFLGAGPDERTEQRRGYRNGHYERTLTTRVGKVELLVPRDREGRFCTELFERYQRSEKAFVLSPMEMYVRGVSTRKVKKITQELCGVDVSKSQVSELAKGLDEQVEALRSRPIKQNYPEVPETLDEEGEQMLEVYALPEGHRQRLRSTNMLERWFEEIRRRTRVVRIFPDRAACLRLIASHCMEANEERLGRRYLSMELERIERELAQWLCGDSQSACELASVPSASSHAETLEM